MRRIAELKRRFSAVGNFSRRASQVWANEALNLVNCPLASLTAS
jgi:hypothetical protein